MRLRFFPLNCGAVFIVQKRLLYAYASHWRDSHYRPIGCKLSGQSALSQSQAAWRQVGGFFMPTPPVGVIGATARSGARLVEYKKDVDAALAKHPAMKGTPK
jgi:hypothetical protein